jgi:hypothetical protein
VRNQAPNEKTRQDKTPGGTEALSSLHLRFDGPVPSELRKGAICGGAQRLRLLCGQANSSLFDRLARSAVFATAQRRLTFVGRGMGVQNNADDKRLLELAGDLTLYRNTGLAWLEWSAPRRSSLLR